jgi:Homing endonuclease associated repeat
MSNRKTIRRHFGSWEKACQLAGLQPMRRPTQGVTQDELFHNLHVVHEALGKLPRQQDMKASTLSRYGASPYLKRFNNWNTTIEAYLRWRAARGCTEVSQQRPLPPPPQRPRSPQQPEASSHAPNDTYGAPRDFRGMRHELTNRDGVLFLFSKVHQELGIIVERLRVGGYSDCETLRQDPQTKRYTKCFIAFEVNSAAFQRHLSRKELCDLLVCWEHDWPDCPMEVLSLKDVLATLQRAGEGSRSA